MKLKSYFKKYFEFSLKILFSFKLIASFFLYLLKMVFPLATSRMKPKEALRFLFNLEDIINQQIDSWAFAYEGGRVHPKHRLMKYHDFFISRVTASDTILDIGCGYGAVANSLAQKVGCPVWGFDSNQDNIDKAKHWWSNKNLTFVVGKAPQDLPEQTFSVVILSNVLEHVENRNVFLKEVVRKARPKKLLIRVPCLQRDWKVYLKREIAVKPFSDPSHYTEYTQESLRKEIEEAGYSITELISCWGEIWAEGQPLNF